METYQITLANTDGLIHYAKTLKEFEFPTNICVTCIEDRQPTLPPNINQILKQSIEKSSRTDPEEIEQIADALNKTVTKTNLALVGRTAMNLLELQLSPIQFVENSTLFKIHPLIDNYVSTRDVVSVIKQHEWLRRLPADLDLIVGNLEIVGKIFTEQKIPFELFENPKRIRWTTAHVTNGINVSLVDGNNINTTTYNLPCTSLDVIRLKVNANLDISVPKSLHPISELIGFEQLEKEGPTLRGARVAMRWILHSLYEYPDGTRVDYHLDSNQRKWIVSTLSWLVENRDKEEFKSAYIRFVDVVINFQRFVPEIKNILLDIFKINGVQKS